MIAPKHTPGMVTLETVPTQIGRCHKLLPFVGCLYEDSVFGTTAKTTQLANAERLRDCWNACEGLADPSVVPDMVRELERLRAVLASEGLRTETTDSLLARAGVSNG